MVLGRDLGARLASLAIGGDEGGVGGGGGLRAIGQHALIHPQCVLCLPAAVASADDRVVRAHLRLGPLPLTRSTSTITSLPAHCPTQRTVMILES
jgi:hypothetical protein